MPRKKSCLYFELQVPEYVPFLTVAVGGAFFVHLGETALVDVSALMGEAKSSQAAMSPLKTFMLTISWVEWFFQQEQ